MSGIRIRSAEEELERLRFEATCNEASALANARRAGAKAGAKTNSIKIAKKMKTKGFNINDIVEMTGLTVEDIQRL